jgi:hypothetical protein
MFLLPGYTCSNWLERNDAQIGYSELEVRNGKIFVPKHIYEDSLIESSLEPLVETMSTVVYKESQLEDIQAERMPVTTSANGGHL